MSEVKYKLVSVGVRYDCDECSEKRGGEPPGEMIADNVQVTLLTYPPQYMHTCNKCGAKRYLGRAYPTVEYKRPSEV